MNKTSAKLDPMPLERELKFSLSDDIPQPEELKTALKPYTLLARGLQKQFDIYFDDAKGSLRAAGIALRKRRTEGQVLATLKTGGTVAGALHEREELEEAMLGAHWPEPILKRLEPITDPWSLTEKLELSTFRTCYLVKHDLQNLALLSFDAVSANYPGVFDTSFFEEVELEAVGDTNEETLTAIAAKLDGLITLTPNSVTKLERAEALLTLAQSFKS
ncbi:MAG: CYTH domain-containing protein [Trueperaceae bacterium]